MTSTFPEFRKRGNLALLQAWVCGNLHESRQRGDHAAHLDGVFEAVAVALSVRVIAHNVG